MNSMPPTPNFISMPPGLLATIFPTMRYFAEQMTLPLDFQEAPPIKRETAPPKKTENRWFMI